MWPAPWSSGWSAAAAGFQLAEKGEWSSSRSRCTVELTYSLKEGRVMKLLHTNGQERIESASKDGGHKQQRTRSEFAQKVTEETQMGLLRERAAEQHQPTAASKQSWLSANQCTSRRTPTDRNTTLHYGASAAAADCRAKPASADPVQTWADNT